MGATSTVRVSWQHYLKIAARYWTGSFFPRLLPLKCSKSWAEEANQAERYLDILQGQWYLGQENRLEAGANSLGEIFDSDAADWVDHWRLGNCDLILLPPLCSFS